MTGTIVDVTGPVSYNMAVNETVWRRHADQLRPGHKSLEEAKPAPDRANPAPEAPTPTADAVAIVISRPGSCPTEHSATPGPETVSETTTAAGATEEFSSVEPGRGKTATTEASLVNVPTSSSPTITTTRSGRAVRTPARYQDYTKY